MFVGPHYAATYQRAYSSLDIVRAHPLVTLAVPPLLAVAAVAAVRHPATVGLAYFGAYVALVRLPLLRPVAGAADALPAAAGGAARRPREAPVLAAALRVVAAVGAGAVPARGLGAQPGLRGGAPAWDGPPLPGWATLLGLARAGGELRGRGGGRARRQPRAGVPLPWPSYAVLSAQVLWFTIGLFHPFFNITLVPIFHSLQYLALTSWHACHGRGAAGPRRFAGYVARDACSSASRSTPACSCCSATGAGRADGLLVSAAVISFVNLHHFLLDGRIWRLRERRVVQAMVG